MVASTCAQATKKKQRMVFYTMPEYEAWKESLGGNTAGWSIKYYKPLTSTASALCGEVRRCVDHVAGAQCGYLYLWSLQVPSWDPFFVVASKGPTLGQMRKLRVASSCFFVAGPQDDMSIEMAFSKKKIDERKNWLSSFCPGTYLDNSGNTIGYSDFINKVRPLTGWACLARLCVSTSCCMCDMISDLQRVTLWMYMTKSLPPNIAAWESVLGLFAEHSLLTGKGRQHRQELILFSRADLERSIPSMVDGLKPGQRKIMFASFKRNLSKDIKVGCLGWQHERGCHACFGRRPPFCFHAAFKKAPSFV
eukprot:1156951-Pelagomonas_calceolata.AAC.4